MLPPSSVGIAFSLLQFSVQRGGTSNIVAFCPAALQRSRNAPLFSSFATLHCPTARWRFCGGNAFRIAFADGVQVEQCLTECTADVNCAGISHKVGGNLSKIAPCCTAILLWAKTAAFLHVRSQPTVKAHVETDTFLRCLALKYE
jgi:hypothetical protein